VKALFSILLASIVLLSSTGWTRYEHYCPKSNKRWVSHLVAASPGCQHDAGQDCCHKPKANACAHETGQSCSAKQACSPTKTKKNCCKDEVIYQAADLDFTLVQHELPAFNLYFTLPQAFVFEYAQAAVVPILQVSYQANAPPRSGRFRRILYQSFRC
jgi:hypothetical protein